MSPEIQSRTRSQALQHRAERFFPGGVNSPVRAFRAVGGAPPIVESALGAWITDADGNRYIDYFGSWGPMILGQLRRIHRRRGQPCRARRRLLPRH